MCFASRVLPEQLAPLHRSAPLWSNGQAPHPMPTMMRRLFAMMSAVVHGGLLERGGHVSRRLIDFLAKECGGKRM